MASKIEICNVALASIGADAIRDFSEKNKRARMCDVFFDITRDYLLARFDWPFARAYKKLNQVVTTDDIPSNFFPYQLPADCLAARDLAPRGSNVQFSVLGELLLSRLESDVYLHYTTSAVSEIDFSNAFSNLLAIGIAARIAPAISKDKAITKMMYEEFQREQIDMWAGEANIGNDWVDHDGDPMNDNFVNPESDYTDPYTGE